MTGRILNCKCFSKIADKTWGKGLRLHNFAPHGMGGQPGWRCVVCKDVKRD